MQLGLNSLGFSPISAQSVLPEELCKRKASLFRSGAVSSRAKLLRHKGIFGLPLNG